MHYVWHYAPMSGLPAITASGALIGSNSGAPGERAMLWFSAHQTWEPTATKMVRTRAQELVQLTFEQQAQTLGCIRFGLPAEDPRLLDWKAACDVAGTPRATRRALERAGRKQGADPAQWFATTSAVRLDELRLQAWGADWQDA